MAKGPRSFRECDGSDMSRHPTHNKLNHEKIDVLIEWRAYRAPPNSAEKTAYLNTSIDLARLLHTSQNLPEYRTLDCAGVIDDVEFIPHPRIGLYVLSTESRFATCKTPSCSRDRNASDLEDHIRASQRSLAEASVPCSDYYAVIARMSTVYPNSLPLLPPTAVVTPKSIRYTYYSVPLDQADLNKNPSCRDPFRV
ncbi:hypothetical protein BJY00DRAFT_307930 [Aspergillus carlsbadensis]|nr:hypothetical protein BJY00DRAFT_307930 [Aspergillus carlsbadensis]